MNDRKLVRIQEKGQVTIPQAIRKKLGLKQGDLVAVMETPETACLSRRSRWWRPKPWIALATSLRNKASRLRRLSAQDGNCARISCKKRMVSPKPQRRIFLDSSVLYAAAFSATGPARRLILKGLEGSVTLAISDLV